MMKTIGCAWAIAIAAPAAAAQTSAALPLAETREIVITDAWSGFNAYSPVRSAYTLRRAGDGSFAGTATLRVGNGYVRRDTTFAVFLKAPAAAALLEALARVPVREGRYTPRIEHSDDSPDITALFRTAAGEVRFHTGSHGAAPAPWQVVSGGREMVSESGEAWQALNPVFDALGGRARRALVAAVDADPELECAFPAPDDAPRIPRPRYARDEAWFQRGEPITVAGVAYVKYGVPRRLLRSDIEPYRDDRGVTTYAEAPSAERPHPPARAPDVLYVPVGPSCLVQPYQQDDGR